MRLQYTGLFALAAALLLLASCNQGPGDSTDPQTDLVPASIKISGPSQDSVGGDVLIGLVVRNAAGDTLVAQATWTSSDTLRIPIQVVESLPESLSESLPIGSHNVRVRPRRIGTARIIASVGGLRDTLVFTSYLPRVRFVFADTAPEAVRLRIQDAIQDGYAFQRLAFDNRLNDSVTISAVYQAAGCAGGGAAAFASGRAVTFCLGNQGWRAHGPGIQQKIVQHELFHLWQFAFWGADPDKTPAWLLEGAAEVVAFRGIAARSLLTFDNALGCQVKESSDFATRQPPGLPPLQNVESRQAFQNTQGPLYTHSMLASEYLINEGDGIAALEFYGNAIRAGATWQDAFQQAFKTTPATFYSQFPGYVSGLPVPAIFLCGI